MSLRKTFSWRPVGIFEKDLEQLQIPPAAHPLNSQTALCEQIRSEMNLGAAVLLAAAIRIDGRILHLLVIMLTICAG
jgi:hypothetical protein